MTPAGATVAGTEESGKTFVRIVAHVPSNPPAWGKRPHCSHRCLRNTSSSWLKCHGTPATRNADENLSCSPALLPTPA
jgi:hypothetical protein